MQLFSDVFGILAQAFFFLSVCLIWFLLFQVTFKMMPRPQRYGFAPNIIRENYSFDLSSVVRTVQYMCVYRCVCIHVCVYMCGRCSWENMDLHSGFVYLRCYCLCYCCCLCFYCCCLCCYYCCCVVVIVVVIRLTSSFFKTWSITCTILWVSMDGLFTCLITWPVGSVSYALSLGEYVHRMHALTCNEHVSWQWVCLNIRI